MAMYPGDTPDTDIREDYLAERYKAETQSLERWWAQQVPPAAPAGQTGQKSPDMALTMTPRGPRQEPASEALTPRFQGQQGGLEAGTAEAVMSTLGNAISKAFNPTLADRVLRYVGVETQDSSEQIRAEMVKMGLPPDVAMIIESAMSGVHGSAPVPPGGQPRRVTPAGTAAPQVGEELLSNLTLDPQRFQYKIQQASGGETGSLAGVQTYDPNLAGIYQVWRDPVDGKTYIVNGHNRAGLAQRAGVERVPVRYLNVQTAEEARTIGALTNIAEGRGTPIDAAKLFRDTGITRAELEARGIPLREKIATDGLALANLQDSLFNDVIQGQLPLERGVIIGSRIADHDQQLKLVQLLRAEAAKGRRIGNEQVRELADFVQSSPSTQMVQESLFGAEESTVSLALDKARIAAAIRERLSSDRALFGRVGKESAASRLTEAGNVINVEESQRLAQQSASLLEIFDRLKNSTGDISDILNDAAKRLHAGESFDAVRTDTYQRLSQALPQAITRAEASGALGATGGNQPEQPQTSTGDLLTAEAERTRGAVSAEGVPIREQAPEGAAPSAPPAPSAPSAPSGIPRTSSLDDAIRSAYRDNPKDVIGGGLILRAGDVVNTASTNVSEHLEAINNAIARERLTATVGSIDDLLQQTGAIRARVDPSAPGASTLSLEFSGPISSAQYAAIMRQAAKGIDGVMIDAPGGSQVFELPRQRAEFRAYLERVTEPTSTTAIPPTPELPPRPPSPEAPAAQQLLTGEGVSGPTRLNIARVEAENRVKTVMETVNRLNVESGATSTAVRGVVTRAATEAAAEGKVSVEQLLARQPGEMLPGIPLDEQITAARRLRVTSGNYLDELAGRVVAGDPEAADLIYDALALHGKIDESVTGLSAEIGRALSAHNILATARGDVNIEALGEIAEGLRSGAPLGADPSMGIPVTVSPERLAQILMAARRANGAQAVNTMAGQVVKHPRVNLLLEAWINGLLSNPPTHAANFSSNMITTFWAIPERALAAQLRPGVDTGVMKGEATQMLYGLFNGAMDAFTVASQSFRAGQPMTGMSRLDIVPSIPSEVLNLTGVPGRAMDVLGTVVRTPGRFLMAADEFFKAINYRMELHAQAFRQAAMEGLDGDNMARRVAAIVSNPGPTIKNAAENFAAYQTFTTELGPLGQGFLSFANSHPSIRLLVPFIRTPVNIFKYAQEHTPLLNLMAESTRTALKTPGPARDMALARVSLGAMVMTTASALSAGGIITGGGPSDPDLRARLMETGWRPYSVKVDDTYYSYNRLEPVGMLLGIAANLTEMRGELPDADFDQLAMAAVLSTFETVVSKTYMEMISNVFAAIRDPDTRGVNILRNLARSVVPAGVANIARQIDPVMREANGLIDEIRARTPGWSMTLSPRRNLWGDPIMIEGAWGPDILSFVAIGTDKHDPVSNEIVRLKIGLSMPSKFLGGSPIPDSPMSEERAGHGVRLTPEEYDLLVRLAGNELKGPSGRGLHETLARLIKTPEYLRQQDGPDGGKAFAIRRTVQNYREAAQCELRRRSPELEELIRERIRERLGPRARTAPCLGIAR